MISALVPVKAPARAKSRLVPHLGREMAQRLALAMMGDVVEALLGVRGLARVVVVTPDPEVARAAEEAAAQASDLEKLLAAPEEPCVVLAPSSDGGTSALLRVPHDAIPAHFGPDSAKRHREAAARAGVPYRELPLPSLAVDVDVREDLEALLRMAPIGRRTRALLDGLRGNADR